MSNSVSSEGFGISGLGAAGGHGYNATITSGMHTVYKSTSAQMAVTQVETAATSVMPGHSMKGEHTMPSHPMMEDNPMPSHSMEGGDYMPGHSMTGDNSMPEHSMMGDDSMPTVASTSTFTHIIVETHGGNSVTMGVETTAQVNFHPQDHRIASRSNTQQPALTTFIPEFSTPASVIATETAGPYNIPGNQTTAIAASGTDTRANPPSFTAGADSVGSGMAYGVIGAAVVAFVVAGVESETVVDQHSEYGVPGQVMGNREHKCWIDSTHRAMVF
jgi:hypothetical protein